MARTKGAKNRATIIAEQMIAEGMTLKDAKVKARMQAAREKKAALRGDAEKKTTKKATKKTAEKTEKKIRGRKTTKEMHPFVAGFNTTTKSAWNKSQMTNSRKFAIRAMCLMCVGGSVKEVKECSAEKTCPLWKFRITG